MGLIGGMARTAVVAGTATAVSNRVSRRQARRWGAQDQPDPYQSAPPQQYAPPPQQYAPPPQTYAPPPQQYAPPPDPYAAAAPDAAAAEDDPTIAQLQKLAALRNQGALTEQEFAAAKAKLLGL